MERLYSIKRWDAVLSTNNKPMPLLYIKPDLELVDIIDKNGGKLWILINDSDSGYDGNIYYTVASKSAVMPNPRPNYFNTTGYWTLAVDSNSWLGYPPDMGNITILDSPYQTQESVESHMPEYKEPFKVTNVKTSNVKTPIVSSNTTVIRSEPKTICFEQNKILMFIILIMFLLTVGGYFVMKK